MSSIKNLLNSDEAAFLSNIANQLGISVNELEELHYEIQENIGNDDIVYGHFIEFDLERSPKSILKKIKDLKNNCSIIEIYI